MGANDKLLNSFKEKSFQEVREFLYNQFFLYNLILIGFTIMSLSFLNHFHYLFISSYNIFISMSILCPIIYLTVRSIYGLILLQDGYLVYHHQLILEYPILFIIGYQIILLSFIDKELIYCFESCLLVLTVILMKRFKKEIIFLSSIIVLLGILYYLKLYIMANLYLVFLTYMVTMLFMMPLLFSERREIEEELKLISLGYKNHPQGKVKDYIS